MNATEALPYPREDPEALEAAARLARRVAAWAEELGADVGRGGARSTGTWDGPAARACRRELRAVARLTTLPSAPLYRVANSLAALGQRVGDVRHAVDRLRLVYDDVVDATRRELAALQATSTIPAPVRHLLAEERRSVQVHDLAQLHTQHRELLSDLDAHVLRTARHVRALAGEIAPGGGAVTGREAELSTLLPMLSAARLAAGVQAGIPTAGADPTLVRAWWRALTTDEQDRLVARHPARLGVLGGLSAAVRSRANEQHLHRRIAALRADAGRSRGEQRELDNCLVVRERLSVLRREQDPISGRHLVVQLLVFQPGAFGGEGRVAVGIGDVDSAEHLAVMVPGLGSDVRRTLDGLSQHALRVTTQARMLDQDSSTATVAWIGYDAPELDDVSQDGAAERGADLLAADLLAMQEARDVLPHLTVIGHSYGSTTAGTSLRDHDTGADDLVLVGSPGPNVERVTDLRVPAGHVFVGASSRDPVSYLDRFGIDPSHERFGAVRFQAEDPTRNRGMLDLDDHSKYFEHKTESLTNVVRVVVGDQDSVVPAQYREERWLLPDGINSDPEADRAPTVQP